MYFTDFRTKAFGDRLPTKLKKMIKGWDRRDRHGRQVRGHQSCISSELGNIGYTRAPTARARAVADVKELGGKPFLTDCNTMYPGKRKNALGSVRLGERVPPDGRLPILIGDGLKGTDDIAPCASAGGEYVKEARRSAGMHGRRLHQPDQPISRSHGRQASVAPSRTSA